jgi:hypothetical protein
MALEEHGKRWQLLERVFEKCKGRMYVTCDALKICKEELGMEENQEAGSAIGYWTQLDYFHGYSGGHVTLTAAGVAAVTDVAMDLLRKDSQFPPILVLSELENRKISPRSVALLRGSGIFESVHVEIGVRQLLFLQAIFASKRETSVGEGPFTVVPKDEITRELVRWASIGAVRIGGEDEEKPENRISKSWHEFRRQIGKQAPELKDLFLEIFIGPEPNRVFYGIMLPSRSVATQLWNVDRLLEEAAGGKDGESERPRVSPSEDEDHESEIDFFGDDDE